MSHWKSRRECSLWPVAELANAQRDWNEHRQPCPVCNARWNSRWLCDLRNLPTARVDLRFASARKDHAALASSGVWCCRGRHLHRQWCISEYRSGNAVLLNSGSKCIPHSDYPLCLFPAADFAMNFPTTWWYSRCTTARTRDQSTPK